MPTLTLIPALNDYNSTSQSAQNGLTSAIQSLKTHAKEEFECPICLDPLTPLTHQAQEDTRSDESDSDSSHGSDEGSDDDEFGWQRQGNGTYQHHNYYGVDDEEHVEENDERRHNNKNDHDNEIHQYDNESNDLQIHDEEQPTLTHIDAFNLVQPTNDDTRDDGCGSAVMPAASLVRIKKRPRETTSSSSIERRGPRSKKQAKKRPQSALHETAEVAGTTAQTPLVRRSLKSAMAKAREGTFQDTSARAGSEVHVEETDGYLMPILDHGHDDHDKDGKKGIVAKPSPQRTIKSFDQHFTDLMGFKEKFGHCKVRRMQSGKYHSLGHWCNNLRMSYKQIQKGETSHMKLTQENIRQLEDEGFKWDLSTSITFDKWFAELMKFKKKFGHCVPPSKSCDEYQSLGNWCSNTRVAYKKIQNKQKSNHILTEEMIRQLDDAGFRWSVFKTFDDRYAELMKYKEKKGHCNPTQKRTGAEYQSLSIWCSNMRASYKKMQKNETPHHKLTEEMIRQLEDAGFKWSLKTHVM